jgi:threonyl-tRNA synthetase
MNCPGSMLVYKQNLHSYKEFPLRMGELGLVHRHEMSGVLHGLMRVRAFTQDDAHIFMLPEQIIDEIKGVINLVDRFYSLFGFPYHVELSTRPENSMGSDEIGKRLLRRCARLWKKKASITKSMKAMVLSMVPKSIFTCMMPWTGPGNAAPSSWIFRCRKNLI